MTQKDHHFWGVLDKKVISFLKEKKGDTIIS